MKPTKRRDILLKAADIMQSRLEENAEIMRTETGSDETSSLHWVAPMSVALLRDIAGRITSICGSLPVVEEEGKSAAIFKEPMGVILGICPWNAPFVFGIRSAANALASGNTTVLKVSELSPRCFWALAKAFEEAGLPPGCLNVLTCQPQDAPSVVNAIIEHPAIRKVNFTGSTSTGRKIATACAKNLKPSLMELGGKNSAIICADANIETAVKGVFLGFTLNSGQICMSTDRVIIHADIAPAFIDALKATLTASFDGSALPPTLVTPASKARVQAMISSAVDSGAHIIYGSTEDSKSVKGDSGVRMAPILLGGAKEDMSIWQDEAFASLAACMVVSSDEEAIKAANRGGYGLSASVFSEDLKKAFKIAKKIESGAVHINSMSVHDEAVLPHGGVRNSGWGRFNGNQGIEEFLVTKTVTWMD